MNLVMDLAIIMMAAGVFTVISKALKQPLILGYIVAGFIVGPHLGLFPIGMESVEQWSEIGIIFLLFALGLEFSFKKLIKVGTSALVTAGVKCIGMFAVGILLGDLIGWTTMESIFLGGLLSMSSTTIIIKAYDDMGLKNRPHSTLLFGSLVFEDLIAVLLMVLLSTLAVSNRFAGGEMMLALAKLGFFIVLWFLVGIYLIPLLLKWAHRFLNDEILLMVAIGLCFVMVVVAEGVGFSSALGAFVMGSILAETIEGERIEHLIGGIKDLFGAVFFVSVGMMVDPAVIGEYWLVIIIITVAAMIGILFFSSFGALLTGQGVKNSLHVGFSLAQLGEFAFIIAGLGCSLGVMRDFIYPVIIAVSVITTFTTPYMIKAADPASDWICRKLPKKLIERLEPSADANKRNSAAAENEWKKLLKQFFIRLLVFGVLLAGVVLLSRSYLIGWLEGAFPSWSGTLRGWVAAIVTVIVMSPFLIALVTNGTAANESAKLLIKEKSQNKWGVLSLQSLRIVIAAFAGAVPFFIFLDLQYWAILLLVVFSIAVYYIAQRRIEKLSFIEDTFTANLNEKEKRERAAKPITTSVQDKLANYDVHIESVEISPAFIHIGKTLREMPFRHVSDVNIIELMRGKRCIRVPRGDERIYPHDILLAVGSTKQIDEFRKIINDNTKSEAEYVPQEFVVKVVDLDEKSVLVGKSLRDSGMRAAGCMIVSILRGNDFITNPKPDDVLNAGDRIWIAGERQSCEWFA